MPRTLKSPATRAQEALDVAQRRVDRLTKQRDDLADQLKGVERDLADAVRRRDYAAQNPDLPQPPTREEPAHE